MPVTKGKNPHILIKDEVFRKTAEALKVADYMIQSPKFLRFLANEIDEKKYAYLQYICRNLKRESKGERKRFVIGTPFADRLCNLHQFSSIAAIVETILTGIRHLPEEEQKEMIDKFYKQEEIRANERSRNTERLWKEVFGD